MPVAAIGDPSLPEETLLEIYLALVCQGTDRSSILNSRPTSYIVVRRKKSRKPKSLA
jgi:hypothetical protein